MQIKNDDIEILQRWTENWEKQLVQYVNKYKDNMLARNVLPVRTVGADVAVDNPELYTSDVTGGGIYQKGTVPNMVGFNVSTAKYELMQIGAGFTVNQKDLKFDSTHKSRKLDIAMKSIHRFEDQMALEGVSNAGLSGLVDAAQANSNGTITAATNKGAWSGEAGTDIYDDILTGLNKIDQRFDDQNTKLVGKKTDLQYLWRMDSERQPYITTIAPLFGTTGDKFLFKTANFSTSVTNKVYLVPNDNEAGEFVVSEQPHLVSYNMMPGQNYFFEVNSWSTVEMHENDAFVEIAIN